MRKVEVTRHNISGMELLAPDFLEVQYSGDEFYYWEHIKIERLEDYDTEAVAETTAGFMQQIVPEAEVEYEIRKSGVDFEITETDPDPSAVLGSTAFELLLTLKERDPDGYEKLADMVEAMRGDADATDLLQFVTEE